MAHAQLVSSRGRLREQGRAPPTELMRSLMLLHSYILVKSLVRMGDHPVSNTPITLPVRQRLYQHDSVMCTNCIELLFAALWLAV